MRHKFIEPTVRKATYILLAIVLLSGTFYGVFSRENKSIHGSLGGEELVLKIADNEALRAQGLSGSSPLSEHEGMLFIFPRSGNYGFFMKDMLYPIDIIWLDEKYRIVGVEERAMPESYPKVFYPASPARYVVELRAGFYSDYNINMGDVLKMSK
ncbi:MAG: DUF192 domain-containing protein [Patescibacteria group bacterium]